MSRRRIFGLIFAAGLITLAGWGGVRVYRDLTARPPDTIPFEPVRRGDVSFTISADGALQGGNSRMLAAPMTGGGQLVLTSLRRSGDLVKAGDVIAQFDVTEETYKLREAEADLAEAVQQVSQAENEARAREEELEYELLSARADLVQAELEVRRNPLLAAITAKQNLMDLEGARHKLAKLQADYPQRKAALKAAIAIQDAGRTKANVQAGTARKNIEMMTLKAPVDGYLNIERNTSTNFYYPGLEFPIYQVGDQVRPGMAVAQIPDLASYEASAQINEYDRGHLAVGLDAEVRVVALKGRLYRGKVRDLGGTTGPPWNRRFECKLGLLDPSHELRPGMSAKLVIKTETLRSALWIPAQALQESDGRAYVYVRSGAAVSTRDVKLVRRGESQVVIEGLREGELVAMARPDQKKQGAGSGKESASKAVSK